MNMKKTKLVTCECGKSAPYQQIKRDVLNLQYDELKRDSKMTCIMIIISICAFVVMEYALMVITTSDSTGFSWRETRIGLFIGIIICCIIFAILQYSTWFNIAAMSDKKFGQENSFTVSYQQDKFDELDISNEEKDVLRKAELIESKTNSPDGHFEEQLPVEENNERTRTD